jgi:hypothetical protein
MLDVSRQIGMASKPGSRPEKAGAALQRLAVWAKDRVRR